MPLLRPALVLIAALAAPSAQAGSGEPLGNLTLVVENDAMFSDRNYTSGLLLAYVSGARPGDGATRWLGRTLLCADEEDRVRFGVAAGQSLFTPEDTAVAAPLPDQHPYAGWLYGALSLMVESERTLDTLAVELGMVGPASYGEEAQDLAHDVFDDPHAQGWDNQVRNEFTASLYYDRKWRLLGELEWMGVELDLTPNLGFAAGNRLTQANAGVMLRIGDDLDNDFGPVRVRPGLGGGGLLRAADALSAYLFFGAQGRAVAWDISLDGNADGRGPSVDRRPLTGDLQAGLAVQLYRLQAGVTVVVRSSEFQPQKQADVFGSLFLSLAL